MVKQYGKNASMVQVRPSFANRYFYLEGKSGLGNLGIAPTPPTPGPGGWLLPVRGFVYPPTAWSAIAGAGSLASCLRGLAELTYQGLARTFAERGFLYGDMEPPEDGAFVSVMWPESDDGTKGYESEEVPDPPGWSWLHLWQESESEPESVTEERYREWTASGGHVRELGWYPRLVDLMVRTEEMESHGSVASPSFAQLYSCRDYLGESASDPDEWGGLGSESGPMPGSAMPDVAFRHRGARLSDLWALLHQTILSARVRMEIPVAVRGYTYPGGKYSNKAKCGAPPPGLDDALDYPGDPPLPDHFVPLSEVEVGIMGVLGRLRGKDAADRPLAGLAGEDVAWAAEAYLERTRPSGSANALRLGYGPSWVQGFAAESESEDPQDSEESDPPVPPGREPDPEESESLESSESSECVAVGRVSRVTTGSVMYSDPEADCYSVDLNQVREDPVNYHPRPPDARVFKTRPAGTPGADYDDPICDGGAPYSALRLLPSFSVYAWKEVYRTAGWYREGSDTWSRYFTKAGESTFAYSYRRYERWDAQPVLYFDLPSDAVRHGVASGVIRGLDGAIDVNGSAVYAVVSGSQQRGPSVASSRPRTSSFTAWVRIYPTAWRLVRSGADAWLAVTLPRLSGENLARRAVALAKLPAYPGAMPPEPPEPPSGIPADVGDDDIPPSNYTVEEGHAVNRFELVAFTTTSALTEFESLTASVQRYVLLARWRFNADSRSPM